ncbi:unnamed protein product [Penicillium salamii]|nr:unnamed protein product [Penicillium salamii]CAG8248789.1 unnamed protein product [Penicillium salamii]CAG8388497.1 unnamed protein product [Penicillium salamii]CAG8402357.1 unnamed protein product [Penicillium salamii]
MDSSLRFRRKAVPASLSTQNHERFYPAKTIVQRRRMSEATEFYDTEFEGSDSDEESLRQSMQSLGYDSNTTLSSPEPSTPEAVQRNLPPIQLEKGLVEGPSGPHLFRNSRGSSIYEPDTAAGTAEISLYYERSPLQSGFSQSIDTPSHIPFSPNTPNRFPLTSPKTPKALKTVHPDVSQVSEEEIRNWKPSQVAHWLYIAGYTDAVIEKFLINDITGEVLLTLQADDLKELSIHSFGKRREIMISIDYLKATMQTEPEPVPEVPSRFASEASLSHGRSSPESLNYEQNYAQFNQPQINQEQVDHEHIIDEQVAAEWSAPARFTPGRSSPQRRSYAMSVSPTGEILSRETYGQEGNQITPAESVSIVGIEQKIPKAHKCSKGENCSKFRKRQRYLQQLAAENPDAVFQEIDGVIIMGNPGNPETGRNLLRPKSETEPSEVASSDVLGPHYGSSLSQDAVERIPKLPKDDNVRRFLDYQHVDNMAANLRSLPKLMIPTSPDVDDLTTAVTTNRYFTPTHQNDSPTAVQKIGPFSRAHDAQSIDTYRQGTPFSEMDVPITAIPNDPIPRDISQSVPPSMQYGTLFPPYQPALNSAPLTRSTSNNSRHVQPLRRVNEDKPLTPIDNPADLIRSPRVNQHGHNGSQSSVSSNPDVTHSGYMRKRKTSGILRQHEWSKAHFTLNGTNLAMHKNQSEAHRISRALENIDVDDYAVACSSQATSSKLTAAFKRSIMRNGNSAVDNRDGTAFSFSLIPATKENEKKALFGNKGIKNHHFAVDSREQRIDWMRELMLAKALKKGKDSGDDILVNGNPWI